MRQPPDKYNSPEKARVRRELWLPAVERAVVAARESYPWRRPRYLTVCGAEARDVRMFVEEHQFFEPRDVFAIDTTKAALAKAKEKFPDIHPHEGRFEDVVAGQRLERDYPFDVVNADLNGNCFDQQELSVPRKLAAISRLCAMQARFATSFALLLTFEGSHQPDREGSDRLVTTVLRDHATRLGENEGYFRLARYGIAKDYDRTMLEVIPSVVLRMAGEVGFDARVDSKVSYRPSNYPTKVRMIGFVIEARWAGPAPSVPHVHWLQDATSRIAERQREGVLLAASDVGRRRAGRKPSRDRRKR